MSTPSSLPPSVTPDGRSDRPFTEVSLGYLANRLAREFVAAVQHRLAPLGVQPGQLPTLLQLYEQDDRSQTELARAVGVEQPTMANTLRRMERDGLVERVADPEDGRRALVRLTDRARQLEPAIRAELDQVNATAADGMSDDQVHATARTMTTMVASLATLREDPPQGVVGGVDREDSDI